MPSTEYTCPTCKTNDRDQYTRCFHPMCPDGRDQDDGVRYPPSNSSRRWGIGAILLALAIFALVTVLVIAELRSKKRPPPRPHAHFAVTM